mgnify:CR=1 FL=1
MSKFEINRNGVFFIINVNAILTLQLRPRYGHFHECKTKPKTKPLDKNPNIFQLSPRVMNRSESKSEISSDFIRSAKQPKPQHVCLSQLRLHGLMRPS